MNWSAILEGVKARSFLKIARCISLIENEVPGYDTFLQSIPQINQPIIGITGPPGAGKSTLTDGLIKQLVSHDKTVAVLCIDPSSPFNMGALLGDRIRMSQWYNHPNVYIRSLASRGSLGGLHPKIIEITEVLKLAQFDYIIIETVGVGQSEIEIAGLADTTVVVLVPEAGDEIQTMKAGLMEIAHIFIVNKADRPEADLFANNLRQMLSPAFVHTEWEIPILKTIATQDSGTDSLVALIEKHQQFNKTNHRKLWLLTQKAYYLIQQLRMDDIDKSELKKEIDRLLQKNQFSLFNFIAKYKQ